MVFLTRTAFVSLSDRRVPVRLAVEPKVINYEVFRMSRLIRDPALMLRSLG